MDEQRLRAYERGAQADQRVLEAAVDGIVDMTNIVVSWPNT